MQTVTSRRHALVGRFRDAAGAGRGARTPRRADARPGPRPETAPKDAPEAAWAAGRAPADDHDAPHDELADPGPPNRTPPAARGRTWLLLDGARLVADARRAGVRIDTLIVAASALRAGEAAIEALAAACAADGSLVAAGSATVMAAVSPLRSPSAAVALARHRPVPLDRVLDPAAGGCVIAPAGVQDPGNLGAIIRAADAAGAAGVAVAAGSADPFGWKALRGAMGSTFRIPVADAGPERALLDAAARAGRRVLAAVPRGGRSVYAVDWRPPLLVLLGGEGAGVDPGAAAAADGALSIPMAGGVDSLNVAVAAALIAYEARRPRHGHAA